MTQCHYPIFFISNYLHMKFTIKEVIFTDKTKEWKELLNWRNQKFFMLHLIVEEAEKDLNITWNKFWKVISKYYTTDESVKIKQKLKAWQVYHMEIKESWIYKNIVSIMDLKWNIIM